MRGLRADGPTLLLGFFYATGLGLLRLLFTSLVRVGRSVSQYAAQWATPQGGVGGLRYVALGDSAAQGVGASRREVAYVDLLAADG